MATGITMGSKEDIFKVFCTKCGHQASWYDTVKKTPLKDGKNSLETRILFKQSKTSEQMHMWVQTNLAPSEENTSHFISNLKNPHMSYVSKVSKVWERKHGLFLEELCNKGVE